MFGRVMGSPEWDPRDGRRCCLRKRFTRQVGLFGFTLQKTRKGPGENTCMELCNDLRQIRRTARREQAENLAFRSWLASAPMSDLDLDRLVVQLAREATKLADCIACHNCCVVFQPQATDAEIDRLSEFVGIPRAEFIRDHTLSTALADVLLQRRPVNRPDPAGCEGSDACEFLLEGRCTVYEARPAHCASFPDLLEGGFRRRLWTLVEDCSVCPIVFNVFRELKRQLWDRG